MILSIIFGLVIGVLLGNFASTVLYRLPKGIPLHGYNPKIGAAPHCSRCGHQLKFYEYLPVLSWVFARGRCNYCHQPINIEYFILEFSTALLGALLYFIANGFNENYILLLFAGTAFILFILMKNKSLFHANFILFITAVIGALYNTLNEASILNWITSFLVAYFIYTALTTRLQNHDIIEKYNLNLLMVAGAWLSIPYLLSYLALLLALQRISTLKINHIHAVILLYCTILLVIYYTNSRL